MPLRCCAFFFIDTTFKIGLIKMFEALSVSFVLGLLRGFDGAEFLRESLVATRTRGNGRRIPDAAIF